MEYLREHISNFFSSIDFDATTHTYHVEGKIVPSVSSIISRYKKPFDKKYWLKVKSKELGITPKELEAQWDKKRDDACDLGHHWHLYIEQRLLNLPITVEPVNLVDRYLDQDDSTTLFCELVMGNPYLTGTLDNLIFRGNKLVIRDWKTNGKFRKQSQYTLLPPFNNVPSTEYYIYTIQQNLYRRLLMMVPELKGIEVDLEIVWFDRANDNWETYQLPIKNDWCNYIIRKLVEEYDN